MKAYAGAIICVEDVLGGFNVMGRRTVMLRALFRKHYFHKPTISEIDALWNDTDGSVTLSRGLGDGFWETFEKAAPDFVKPEHITLPDGAKEFAEELCYPNVGLIFNSPKGTYDAVLQALGIDRKDLCFVGSLHYSATKELGARRSLGILVEDALSRMRFCYEKFTRKTTNVVYIDKGTELGFAAAKGRHLDYWAVDLNAIRGTKTKYVFKHIVHSISDLRRHVRFFNMSVILESLQEDGYVIEPRRESRRDKKASRKNKKHRKKH